MIISFNNVRELLNISYIKLSTITGLLAITLVTPSSYGFGLIPLAQCTLHLTLSTIRSWLGGISVYAL